MNAILHKWYGINPTERKMKMIYDVYKRYGAPITETIARGLTSGLDTDLPDVGCFLYWHDLYEVLSEGDGEYSQFQIDNRDCLTKKVLGE